MVSTNRVRRSEKLRGDPCESFVPKTSNEIRGSRGLQPNRKWVHEMGGVGSRGEVIVTHIVNANALFLFQFRYSCC